MSGSFRTYEYSVVETAAMLASTATGTLQGVPTEALEARLAWLRWRLKEEWDDPASELTRDYDALVREMAWAAIRMYVTIVERATR